METTLLKGVMSYDTDGCEFACPVCQRAAPLIRYIVAPISAEDGQCRFGQQHRCLGCALTWLFFPLSEKGASG
jgi:hypothetical protein